jgi:predicted RNase H-like HicB family nuclease
MADAIFSRVGKIEKGRHGLGQGAFYARIELSHATIEGTGESEREALDNLHSALDVTLEDAEDAQSHVEIEIDQLED